MPALLASETGGGLLPKIRTPGELESVLGAEKGLGLVVTEELDVVVGMGGGLFRLKIA